jgi:hypothetical protein
MYNFLSLISYSSKLHPSYLKDVPALSNNEYDEFIHDINIVLPFGNSVAINLYTDASGIAFALDSNGNPIKNRQVIETVYTFPYTDVSGNWHDGTFLVIFDDNSRFYNTDSNNLAYWYSLLGDNPLVLKQFT